MLAIADNRSGCLVARTLNPQNVTLRHTSILLDLAVHRRGRKGRKGIKIRHSPQRAVFILCGETAVNAKVVD
jgi:hypothetical protein